MLADLKHATALDPHFYTNPDWAIFERDYIFRKSWQYVGHVGDLATKGDHVVAEGVDVAKRADDDIAFTDQVQAEDAAICQHVQRGLTSGSYVPGRLSPKREEGLWHFQNLLRGDYANGD